MTLFFSTLYHKFGKMKIDCVESIAIQILKLLKIYLKKPCSELLFLKQASSFM